MNDELSNNKKEMEELLGKPFVEEIPNNLWATRRNLLFFSNIASASVIFDWKIASDNTLNTPIGVLKGINDNHFYIILFLIIVYLWSFFWISSKAYISRKKIRGTGLSGSYPRLAGFIIPKIGTYPENIKQHTLYSFWLENKNIVQENFQILTNFCKKISQNQDQEFISSNILKTKDASEKLSEIFGNSYILTALERFDKEFKNHQNKESRKYFLELRLPHILASSAIITISYKLTSNYNYLFKVGFYLKRLIF